MPFTPIDPKNASSYICRMVRQVTGAAPIAEEPLMKLLALLALLLSPAAFAATGEHSHFDRELKSAELATLLPEYVRYIEARSDVIPSAQDNERLRMLAAAIADPTQGSFRAENDGSEELVGHQTYAIQDIIAQAEAEIAELKATTAAERRDQIAKTLEGFKGAKGAGKISCRLGFFSPGQHPIDRIVKCTDDRSRPARGDDEGFTDQREFTLSIDAKTLAPVGVIALEEFTAG